MWLIHRYKTLRTLAPPLLPRTPADPMNTTAIVASTTKKAAVKRIWGEITTFWRSIKGIPGTLRNSTYELLTRSEMPGFEDAPDKSGIFLVAPEQNAESDDSFEDLKGIKQAEGQIILACD